MHRAHRGHDRYDGLGGRFVVVGCRLGRERVVDDPVILLGDEIPEYGVIVASGHHSLGVEASGDEVGPQLFASPHELLHEGYSVVRQGLGGDLAVVEQGLQPYVTDRFGIVDRCDPGER
jgi:hypothetical protein